MADVLATDCCRDSSGLALPNVSQSLKFSRRFHGERGGVDVHIFVLKNTNDGTATAPEQICMTLVNLQVLFFLSRVSTTMLTRDIDIAVLSVRQPVCHVRVLC